MKNYNLYHSLAIGFFLMTIVGAPISVYAQESAEATLLSSSAEPSAFRGTGSGYVLHSGDRVKITIYPEDNYIKGTEMDVSSEGNITLPLLGKIQVAGLSVIEAQRYLVELIDRDYLVDPEVVIEVQLTGQNTFVILGEVKKPGTYPFGTTSGEFTLLQAISTAGGFSAVANIKKIKIIRKSLDGKRQMIKVNADAIIQGKDEDIALKPNDVIHVAESLF